MEMRHHIIGVVQVAVDTGIGEHHACHTTDGEQEDEADRPNHRAGEAQRAAPHRGNPREDFHAGRHRNHHGGEHEIALRVE